MQPSLPCATGLNKNRDSFRFCFRQNKHKNSDVSPKEDYRKDNTTSFLPRAQYPKPECKPVLCSTQIALEALLSAYSGQDWQQSFSSLAIQVTEVGSNHRAHLVALKLLPAHSPRGFALQQAGVASLLQGLCTIPSKVCMPDSST